MIFFWVFFAFVISQRALELVLAKRNEKALKSKGALEFDEKGYRYIVAIHIAFFISLALEEVLLPRGLNRYWVLLLIIFFIAQAVRYWAIATLGVYWNTKVLVVPGSQRVRGGPYKYVEHPNYMAVIVEIAVIPLIFSCYITAILFSMINLVLVRRRVKIEEDALGKSSTEPNWTSRMHN